MSQQTTIKTPITLEGIGLHTGQVVSVKICPAPANHGYKFKRADVENAPSFKALADYVQDTSRCTYLEYKGVGISTVEHLLSALSGLQIDNALLEVTGEELPILDGSALGFVQQIKTAGVETLEAERTVYPIREILRYHNEETGAEIIALPSEELEINVLIDFNSESLPPQHASWKRSDDFEKQIAPARTFCFLHELAYLKQNNLIKGGSLENAVVYVEPSKTPASLDQLAQLFDVSDVQINEAGLLNDTQLRFSNEAARHKLLDVIGDLTLIGMPIQARIIATKPGHASNVAFAKILRDYIKKNRHLPEIPVYDPNQESVFDINEIEKILPHKYPFLLVDKVIELTPTRVVGVKNVTFNESFFQGHFPKNPIMPGVLQIEAMAQTGGILALNAMEGKAEDYTTYFIRIENARFRNKVIPGDTIIFKLDLLRPIRRGICEIKAIAYVGNKVVTEAILVAQIAKR